VTGSQCQSPARDLAVGRLDDLGGFPNCLVSDSGVRVGEGSFGGVEPGGDRGPPLDADGGAPALVEVADGEDTVLVASGRPSCQHPAACRPVRPGLTAAAHGAGSTTAPGPVTAARPPRAAPAGSSAVSPWCPPAPTRIPTPSQTRRASARPSRRCARYRRPFPQPAASTRCRGPPPAPRGPPPRSSSRAAGDPYRTAFAAISLTAITKSSAQAAGRPARTAHRAVTRRTGRGSSAPNRTRTARGNPPLRPAPLTPPPSPTPGRPRNKPTGSRVARDVIGPGDGPCSDWPFPSGRHQD